MDHIQLLLDHQSLLDHRFAIGQGQPSLSPSPVAFSQASDAGLSDLFASARVAAQQAPRVFVVDRVVKERWSFKGGWFVRLSL